MSNPQEESVALVVVALVVALVVVALVVAVVVLLVVRADAVAWIILGLGVVLGGYLVWAGRAR